MTPTNLPEWITLILAVVGGLSLIFGAIIKAYHYAGKDAPAWLSAIADGLAGIAAIFSNGKSPAVNAFATEIDQLVAKLPAAVQKPAEAVLDRYKPAILHDLGKLAARL